MKNGLVCIVAMSMLFWGSAQAQTTPLAAPNPSALAVAQVVLGIISYTAWPVAPSPLRLCIIGRPTDAQTLATDDLQIGTVHIDRQFRAAADPQLGTGCDVIYAGALTAAEHSQLFAAITGHPILTISESDPSCSDNIMFCLAIDGTKTGFSVNLDSVARSGVQVNPKVLLLGRPRQGQQ